LLVDLAIARGAGSYSLLFLDSTVGL
jgi:hypothetical protein